MKGETLNLRYSEAPFLGNALRLGKAKKIKVRWNGSKTRKSLKRTVFKPRFSPIRKVSAKQRKRTFDLAEKKILIFEKQVELYGSPRCEIGASGIKGCGGQLVLDHVNTRNIKNPDAYSNLQVACELHNSLKGSQRKDYRDGKMIAAMVELDRTEQSGQ